MSDLNAYLNAIGRVPLLTADEEILLGTAVRDWLDHPGGPDSAPRSVQRTGRRAKDRMIQANLRLVVTVSRKYLLRARDTGLEQLDLIQEGTLGLIRGVEKFDPARGYKFSTYAYWWIRQGMSRGLAEKAGLVRIPVHTHELLYKVRQTSNVLAQELGREPAPQEVFEYLEFTPGQINTVTVAARARNTFSLDQTCGGEDTSTMLDLVSGEIEDPTQEIDHDMAWALVQAELERLSEQERSVITETVLLGRTGTMVGQEMGVSRARVTEVRRRALNKLRAVRSVRSLAA